MSKDLLVTDLDNTLYDWVTFFGRSLTSMVNVAATALGVARELLIEEFRVENQALGTVEHPFGLLDLPSVRTRYPEASRMELRALLTPAFEAFNSRRREELHLYPGVDQTLKSLRGAGVKVVGHTESALANAYFRLRYLGIEAHFDRLVVVEGAEVRHPDPERERELLPPPGFVITVPQAERKPNPALLMDICRQVGSAPERAVYVGDSLARDVAMARAAGVTAVWARYGRDFAKEDWDTIVGVTHWTERDVQRERLLAEQATGVQPDLTIESFAELRPLFPA